jgi:hypothetical protein
VATLILTDDFERADTAAGGVANGWLDASTLYQINTGRARLASNNGSYLAQLLRPASENVLAQLVTGVIEAPITNTDNLLVLRRQSDGSCYAVNPLPTFGLRLYRISAAGTPTQLTTPAASLTGGTKYRVSAAAINDGSGNPQIEIRIAAEATPNTLIASATFTDTNAAKITAAGQAGLVQIGFSGAKIYDHEVSVYDFTDGVWPTFTTPAVAPGTIAFGSVTPTTVSITSTTAASGGTGSLTYSWHKSQTSGFTPGAGNVLAGQTGAALTSYAAAAGMWFYKRRATDTIAATGDTNQVAAQIQDGTATPVLGFIGDSRWANVPSDASSSLKVPDVVAQILGDVLGLDKKVTFSNQAIGGTTSGDWLPAGTILGPAVTAFNAIGVTDIPIDLGVNDAATLHNVPAATFGSNLSAICTYLLANVPTLQRIWLCYSTYCKPGALNAFGEAGVALLVAYQAQIDALVNGTTRRAGDKLAFRVFAKHAEIDSLVEKWYIGDTVTGANPGGNDWIHFNARGVYADAGLVAQPLLSIFGLSGGTLPAARDVRAGVVYG